MTTYNKRPTCEHCNGRDARKSYRLDPRNWQPRFALLCGPCRTRLHFVVVDHTRAWSERAGRDVMRGAA